MQQTRRLAMQYNHIQNIIQQTKAYKLIYGTTKITVVGDAHNNTKNNLNLRSSVTGLFNSD
jgi:hypothetical protein